MELVIFLPFSLTPPHKSGLKNITGLPILTQACLGCKHHLVTFLPLLFIGQQEGGRSPAFSLYPASLSQYTWACLIGP